MFVQTLTYIQLNPKWQWSVSCTVSDLKSLSGWPGIQHPIHCQSRNPAKTKRRTKTPTWVAVWLVMFFFSELQVFSWCFWTEVYLMRQNNEQNCIHIVSCILKEIYIYIYIFIYLRLLIYIYDPGSRFATTPPPPTWYGPKTCVLQHSAWKRCICSVFCMVGCWCGPQPGKFVGFLQPTFWKRVICNVSASTSWSSAAAPSSISVSNYYIIINLLLRVFSFGTGLISAYILCLSNFLLECLVFRNWSNLKFS